MINLKTSTFLNLHTIMHPSPLNGHNQQWTVLICPPESLLTDRTRPRQDCFQPGRWDPRVWSKQVTNSKDKEGRGGHHFIWFLKQDLYWTLWFLWFIWCDIIAPGLTTISLVHFTGRTPHTAQPAAAKGTTFSSRWENVDRDKVAQWHHKTNRWCCLSNQFHYHQLLVIPGGEWIVRIMREFMIINLRIYHQKCKLLICFEERGRLGEARTKNC